jgi:DNA-binding response OmpR family regulator
MTFLSPVLVVDDEPAMGKMLITHLEEHGIEAVFVAKLDEAFAALQARKFAAVVTDVHLGSRNGLELLERTEQGPPIIVMSAFPSAALRKDAIARGAIAILSKPFGPAALLRLLDSLE